MSVTDAGERRAWELLAGRARDEVCGACGVAWDSGCEGYVAHSFGREFLVDPASRRLAPRDDEGARLLERLAPHLQLALPWCLAKSAGARPRGRLVRPSSLPDGGIFARGTHVLPLDALAQRHGRAPGGFLDAGARAGGAPAPFGDAAIELRPLPGVPVTVILWTADEEFPARADLLFDASAAGLLPVDILWSAAWMSLLVLG
jgi:hypothetical protein